MRLHSVLRDGILRIKTSSSSSARLRPQTLLRLNDDKLACVTYLEKNHVYALPMDFDPTKEKNITDGEFEIHNEMPYFYVNLRGRIVDPLIRPLDGGRVIERDESRERRVNKTRTKIAEPLQTSVRYVDALYPIGKGHRVAIVGPPSTQKRSIARAIACSPDADLTVYLAFGRSRSATAKTIGSLSLRENMIIVATTPEDPIGMQTVAFDTVSRIAQEAQADGLSVSLIVDEMSHYVNLQKRLSNMLPIPAVRASQILEIASQLSPSDGSGSLTVTCLEDVQDPILATSSASISDGLRSSADVFLSTPVRGVLFYHPLLENISEHPRISTLEHQHTHTGTSQGNAIHIFLHATLSVTCELVSLGQDQDKVVLHCGRRGRGRSRVTIRYLGFRGRT